MPVTTNSKISRLHGCWWRMLMTDVGDQMCWWQVWDIGDRFRMLVTDLIHWINHQHNAKSRQHIDSVANISNHYKVTNVTMSPTSLSPISQINIGDDFDTFDHRQHHSHWSHDSDASSFLDISISLLEWIDGQIFCFQQFQIAAMKVTKFVCPWNIKLEVGLCNSYL